MSLQQNNIFGGIWGCSRELSGELLGERIGVFGEHIVYIIWKFESLVVGLYRSN